MQFVKPKEVVIPLPTGETLVVKERLNVGEHFDRMEEMSTIRSDGSIHVHPMKVARVSVLSYLLDWTVTDEDEKGNKIPVPIRGLSKGELSRVLNNLAPEDYKLIVQAIDAHEKAQDAALEAQKKTLTGATASSPISPSPSGVTGPTTTSVN